MWQEYKREWENSITNSAFLKCLELIEKDPQIVTYTSLYVHLLDQFLWGLLSGEETMEAGHQLVDLLAIKFDILPVPITEAILENFIQSRIKMLLQIVHKNRFIFQGE